MMQIAGMLQEWSGMPGDASRGGLLSKTVTSFLAVGAYCRRLFAFGLGL